jgi:uncharacterized heparinase superfamily protein
MNIKLLFHTIAHLKLKQISGRVIKALYHPFPHLHSLQLRATIATIPFPAIKKNALQSSSSISFLNTEMVLDDTNFWNDKGKDALWLYNLHYFDYINSTDYDNKTVIREYLINKWINDNSIGTGIGWDPYPTSLRIVNWIKWHINGNNLSLNAQNSLAVQSRYLFRRIEYHLLANHLFTNAKALIFTGLFFKGNEAELWLKKGLKILARELPEQILDDGGNYERSPMYHSIMLEDLLDLITLFQMYRHHLIENYMNDTLKIAAGKMINWLSAMCHGDGKIALFNDAAFEIAPDYGQLTQYAQISSNIEISQKSSLNDLSKTGYVSYKNDRYTIIIDAGNIGPDYQPGHAHADTFSFELSHSGQRLIVDSGTSCYGTSPERLRQRQTAAHNTVLVDGYDSSEVWAGFRVARRAHIVDRTIENTGQSIQVTASHDGFRRIRGVGNHRRRWELNLDTITIIDTIEGKGNHTIDAYIHFHPEVTITLRDHECSVHYLDVEYMKLILDKTMHVQLSDSTYHPEFGLTIHNKQLHLKTYAILPFQFTSTIKFII